MYFKGSVVKFCFRVNYEDWRPRGNTQVFAVVASATRAGPYSCTNNPWVKNKNFEGRTHTHTESLALSV